MKLPGMLLPLLATTRCPQLQTRFQSACGLCVQLPCARIRDHRDRRNGRFREKATNDFIYIRDGGYTIWARTDRLGRADRQKFLDFYNANC